MTKRMFFWKNNYHKSFDPKENNQLFLSKAIYQTKGSDNLHDYNLSSQKEHSSDIDTIFLPGEEDVIINHDDSIHSEIAIPFKRESKLDLIRKKSGEIVKPVLRESTIQILHDEQLSSSLITRPKYKQVHFGNITDVKYFLEKGKPTDIFSSSSLALDDSSDFEIYDYDLESSDFCLNYGETKYPMHTYSLDILNFLTTVSYVNKTIKENFEIFMENLFLSEDNMFLMGHIAVKNIGFEKAVTVRYTPDNWLTSIEIPASYISSFSSLLKDNNYDRFIFKISADKLFNSFGVRPYFIHTCEYSKFEKLFSFCFRYNSSDREFWDNNYGKNYTIKLSMVIKDVNGPKGALHKFLPYKSDKISLQSN